jgi:FkbM family methyltransferase
VKVGSSVGSLRLDEGQPMTQRSWETEFTRALSRLPLEERYQCAAGVPGPALELRSGAFPRGKSLGTGLFDYVPLVAAVSGLDPSRLRAHRRAIARDYSVRRVSRRLSEITCDWPSRLSLFRDFVQGVVYRATGAASSHNPASSLRKVRLSLAGRTIQLSYPANVVSTGLLWEVFVEECYKVDQPVDLIYDFGANVGMSSLYFHAMHPTAEIVCVEPLDENFSLLKSNLLVNGVKATALHVAVGASAGDRELYFGQQSHALPSMYTKQARSCRVPVVPFDEIITREHNYGLKVDIEGSEGDFSCFPALIANAQWVVGELHYSGHDEQDERVDAFYRLVKQNFVVEEGRPIAYFVGDDVIVCKSFRAIKPTLLARRDPASSEDQMCDLKATLQ